MTSPDDDFGDDPELLEAFLEEAMEHIEAIEAGVMSLETSPDDHETIDALFRSFHTIKGAAAMLSLDGFQRISHAAEQLLDAYRDTRRAVSEEHADLLIGAADILKALAGGNSLAQIGDALDGLVMRLEVAIERFDETSGVRQPKEQAQGNVILPSVDQLAAVRDSTVRVPIERLDRLVDMIGELVIAESMIEQWLSRHVASADMEQAQVGRLTKITRELQEIGTSLRMVPVRPVFQRMARLVRDLAHKLDRPVEFHPTGEDTLLDKSVVDRIVDPLLHLIRNAVDHGIEDPDDRAAAGKSRSGHVHLEAYHRAGSIYIELRDDGRGIDQQKIARRAIEIGLIESAENMSEREILDLIFEPGFSTAVTVTDVSGRGVGMDVVKRDIQSLRGVVEVASTIGIGTVFTIRLPLTLAIIDGMLVRIGAERYIIPILSIKASLRPRYDDVHSVMGGGFVMKHLGHLVPVYPLHALFDCADAVTDPAQGIVVVVDEDGKEAGILVDELLGQQQFVIKALGATERDVEGLSGAAVMADGCVGLIVDVPGLIKLAHSGDTGEMGSLLAQQGEQR